MRKNSFVLSKNKQRKVYTFQSNWNYFYLLATLYTLYIPLFLNRIRLKREVDSYFPNKFCFNIFCKISETKYPLITCLFDPHQVNKNLYVFKISRLKLYIYCRYFCELAYAKLYTNLCKLTLGASPDASFETKLLITFSTEAVS